MKAHWGAICTAAALALVLASNLIDIGRFHASLIEARKQQAASLAAATRVETQLDALAKGTQALADGGNANARAILVTLRQNGVRIHAK